jgi:hypothetical protein
MENSVFSVVCVNAAKAQFINSISAMLRKADFLVVDALVPIPMNTGRKPNKNPYIGRAFEYKIYHKYQAGTSYENRTNNAAEKSGGQGNAKVKVTHFDYYDPFWRVLKSDRNHYYLQLQATKTQKAFTDVIGVYVDGREATPEEIEDINANWRKTKSNTQSSTQIEAGVDKEHEITCFNVDINNILTISFGDTTINVREMLTEFNASEAAKVAEKVAD